MRVGWHGRYVGWVSRELLSWTSPADEMSGLLVAGASGDPNAPTSSFGTPLHGLTGARHPRQRLPATARCEHAVPVFVGESGHEVAGGEVLSGTTFAVTATTGEFVQVAPLGSRLQVDTGMRARRTALEGCRRTSAREGKVKAFQEWSEPEANAEPAVRGVVSVPSEHWDILNLARSYEERGTVGLARGAYSAFLQLPGPPAGERAVAHHRLISLAIVEGDFEEAERVLERSKLQFESLELRVRLALLYLDSSAPAAALAQLPSERIQQMKSLGRAQRAQVHALRGRALDRLGKVSAADEEYRNVLALGDEPYAALNEGASDEELEALRHYWGEAQFREAEKYRAKAALVVFPKYGGDGSLEDIVAHINLGVKGWYQKKKVVLKRATDEYQKLLDYAIAPPPLAVIAAGARVGEFWGQFVSDFRSAPIPKEWEKPVRMGPGTLICGPYDVYEPFKEIAKQACRVTVDYSVAYQIYNEDTRSCEAWLAANYKNDFRRVDELMPQPVHVTPYRETPLPLAK